MDDVIKNKARLNPVQPSKYEPEYVRLNKVPEIFGTADIAGVDDDVFGEDGKLNVDMSGHIIDNNDEVDFGFGSKRQVQQTQSSKIPETNEYILMIFGKVILSGSLNLVEERVKSVIYGQAKEFASVSVDDIVVLKRVSIKVGVFIGE
jgi:hypothetical protein